GQIDKDDLLFEKTSPRFLNNNNFLCVVPYEEKLDPSKELKDPLEKLLAANANYSNRENKNQKRS
ncbi:hypothetical protein, partial [Microcoleus sp. CAWBG58]|uniref:hypothetical protein n=1 Tax=Microcoleus sp. CAWBG58 TaxID=2841651 RepID=UPI0025D3090F